MARATHTPWREVYREWPFALVLALLALELGDQEARTLTRAEELRDLVDSVALAVHTPDRLFQLPRPRDIADAPDPADARRDARVRLEAALAATTPMPVLEAPDGAA